MKKLQFLFLLSILAITLISGCAAEKISSSSMIRTIGVGESAMPIEGGSFATEFFQNEATTIDVISATNPYDWSEPENNLPMSGGKLSKRTDYSGFNFRFGFDNYTELKIGFFSGDVETGSQKFDVIDQDGNYFTRNTKFNTRFDGVQLGLKRLLTDYSNPQRVSLYLDGRYLVTKSEGIAGRYDGNNLEFKSALIFSYLKDPSFRTFPSFSLYYSLANTNRDYTITGIPAKRHPQAVGAEINVNLAYRALYANIAGGLEKEIDDKNSDNVEPYIKTTIGFKIKKNK